MGNAQPSRELRDVTAEGTRIECMHPLDEATRVYCRSLVDPLSVSWLKPSTDVPQGALDDLKRRFDSAPWPERETEEGWSAMLFSSVLRYWRDNH